MHNNYILGCTSNKHGGSMNVNLGAPYEQIIKRIIEREYAGNMTEAIRQALIVYERELEEEEIRLVNKGIDAMMEDVKSGKVKTYTLAEIKKELKIK